MSTENFPLSTPPQPLSPLTPDEARAKEGEEFVHSAGRTIAASIAAHQRLLGNDATMHLIAAATAALVSAFRRGQKVLLFGNGGSAADAQHIAAEFVGRFTLERAALPATALSVNTSCVTAIGNDYGFDLVFARQIEAFGKQGDVAIGISTSGNSPNVLMGLARSKEMGLTTVALAGASGGKMKGSADYCICAPSDETPRIQECHILIGHVIAELAERAIVYGAGSIS
jgi:D-sedoheptulose 7-phosphate isomerase